MTKYEIGFPSERVEKEFYKKLKKLPQKDKIYILQEIEKLSNTEIFLLIISVE